MGLKARERQVQPLDGFWLVFHADDGQVDFDNAQFVRNGTRRSLLAEWTEDGEYWHLRLESTNGRQFKGSMGPKFEGEPIETSMDLWNAPDGDGWLLLGTYHDPEEGETWWCVHLYELHSAALRLRRG